jgi:hypothetical protein
MIEMTTIKTLLLERAGAMATQDGVPVGAVHLHGAANQLQAELLSARDHLIHAPPAPAAAVADQVQSEGAAAPAEAPAAEATAAPAKAKSSKARARKS